MEAQPIFWLSFQVAIFRGPKIIMFAYIMPENTSKYIELIGKSIQAGIKT